MKVILEPKVTVIGRTTFQPHPDYPIPDDGNDATKLCAFAAKGCYDAFGEDGRPNEENQAAILEHRHGSVMEHYYVTFFIEGVTRALTLELNRHRLLNISQRSTRYVKEEDSAIVLEPYYAELYKKWNRIILEMKYDMADEVSQRVSERGVSYCCADQPMLIFAQDSDPCILWGFHSPWDLKEKLGEEYSIIFDHIQHSTMAVFEYQQEVEKLMKLNPNNLSGFDLRKWARGKARNILPHALETRATYTANLRAWRWIIEVRSGKGAEPEIRRLANLLVLELKKIAPAHFADFEVSEIYDGIPVWIAKHGKV